MIGGVGEEGESQVEDQVETQIEDFDYGEEMDVEE